MRIPRHANGFSLIEVLVALCVLAFGMLAMAKLQITSSQASSLATTRTEAIAAAEAKIEELRNFTSYSELGNGSDSDNLDGTSAQLTRSWNISETSTNPAYKTLQVSVTWQERSGEEQRVSLRTYVAAPDPKGMARLLAEESITPSTNTSEQATDEDTTEETPPTPDPDSSDDTATDAADSSVPVTGTSITLSGTFTHFGGSGIQISTVAISGNYPGTCTYTEHSYICEVSDIASGDSWTGQISISSNKTVCTPPDNPTAYNAISTNQVQDYNLGKQASDCP